MSENQVMTPPYPGGEVKPLSPKEAREQKMFTIPTPIIDAVNQILIRESGRKKSYITFKQNELMGIVCSDKQGLEDEGAMVWNGKRYRRDQIFENNWFDFEELFESAGWKVAYDKPGYNETYEPTWTFTEKE